MYWNPHYAMVIPDIVVKRLQEPPAPPRPAAAQAQARLSRFAGLFGSYFPFL